MPSFPTGIPNNAHVGRLPNWADTSETRLRQLHHIHNGIPGLVPGQFNLIQNVEEVDDDEFFTPFFEYKVRLNAGDYRMRRISAEAANDNRVTIKQGNSVLARVTKLGDVQDAFELEEPTNVTITFQTRPEGGTWKKAVAQVTSNYNIAWFCMEDATDADYNDLIVGLRKD